MQASRLLILLSLLAAVLVDLVLLSAVGSLGGGLFRWPDPLLAVLFSLAFSQVSMAAAWAGLSETSLPWRLAGLVGVVTVWSVALAREAADAVDGYGRNDWSVLLLGQALFILAIVLVIRVRGGRLANRFKPNAEPQEGRWQFTLGYLFAWLTATSVALGLLRYTIDYDSLTAGRRWDEVCLVVLSNTAVSLATLWAALGGRGPAWRAAVLCLTTGAVISCSLLHDGAMDEMCLYWALLWVLQIAWLLAWLFVLRTAGFAFVWPVAARDTRIATRSPPVRRV
jgi:hypothetical protein